MILVNVKEKQSQFQNIMISGHAMYDVKGKDIVCSAVSTCVITTINGIVEIDKDAISVIQTKDKIEIEVEKRNEIASKLLKNMLDILESLEQQYPKNIKLSKEEI